MVTGYPKTVRKYERGATLTVSCPSWSKATGGGLNAYPSDTFAISASYPDPTDSTWTVKVENIHPSYFGEVHLTPYVVCLPVG